jgi:Ran-interacting Mog1 protein
MECNAPRLPRQKSQNHLTLNHGFFGQFRRVGACWEEAEGDGSDLERRHLWGGAMECAVSSTNPTVAVAMLGDDESLVFEERWIDATWSTATCGEGRWNAMRHAASSTKIPQPIPHSTMASSGSSAESERVEAEPEGDGSDLERRHLWGGAMECDVPRSFLDVSQIRPLDDTVEMFLDTDSGDSLVFEVLEHDAEQSAEEALRAFFDDICDGNDAAREDLHGIEEAKRDVVIGGVGGEEEGAWRPREVVVCGCDGWQDALRPGGSGGERDRIEVYVAVVRIAEVRSDIVVHFNHRSRRGGDSRDAHDLFWTLIIPSFTIRDKSIFSTDE